VAVAGACAEAGAEAGACAEAEAGGRWQMAEAGAYCAFPVLVHQIA